MSFALTHDDDDLLQGEPQEPHNPQSRAARSMAKLILGAFDLVVVALALVLAYLLRAGAGGPDLHGAVEHHLLLGIGVLPIWIGLYAGGRLYNSRFISRRVDELRRLGTANVRAIVLMAAVGYAFQLDVSRGWLLLALVLVTVLTAVSREVARFTFRRMRCGGRMLRNVVVVGSNDEARAIASMLLEDPTLGYRVVGFVDDDPDGSDLLGPVDQTLQVVRRTGAGGVIVAASAISVGASNHLVRKLVQAGIHVELSSTLRDVAAERLTVRSLGRFPILYIEPRGPIGWRRLAKRTFDLVGAAGGLLLLTPVMVAISLAVRFDSRGPVIFRQVRVGRDGEHFKVLKFRTMHTDAESRLAELLALNEADGPLFKLRDDPRVTRVGRFLRKTSLDELPQLLNVLKGEMSLVGPRPALPAECSAWELALHDRLRVQPGITGMWQVNGRSESTFESYVRHDLYYVDNWSLLTDLSILAKTLPAVLFGRGAY